MESRWADEEEAKVEADQKTTKTLPSKGLEASKWADSGDEEEETRKEKVELKSKHKKERNSPKKSPKKDVKHQHDHDNHMGQRGKSLAQRLSPRKEEDVQKTPSSVERKDRHGQHHRSRETAHNERERNRMRKLQAPKLDWDKDNSGNGPSNEPKPKEDNLKSKSSAPVSKPPPKLEEKPLSKEELDKMFKDLAGMQTLDWDDDEL